MTGNTTETGTPMRRFLDALIAMDAAGARAILDAQPRDGLPFSALEHLIVPALEAIGSGWEDGTIALSQVYMCGRICVELVDAILPAGDPRRLGRPRTAIAVLEDHHVLGKRVVSAALRSAGFQPIDYGHGVPAEDLVRRVLQDGVEVLLISTLMLRAALRVKDVTAALRGAGRRVHVAVGGAPFLLDGELWKEVGADEMGRNASDALAILRRFAEPRS